MIVVLSFLSVAITPAEAAVVEGGVRVVVVIDRIQAIRAGADPVGADDTYITVNGLRLWGEFSMSTGQTRGVNRSYTGPGSSARVQLFDADPGNHDGLGGFTAVNTRGVLTRARVSGSGSTYDVFYRASA